MHVDANGGTEARMLQEQTRLLTPQEVADFLGMPVATLKTWRSKRTGPRAYRIGKHVRYRLDDIEVWLAERPASAP
jgi:excisionase family DNA binding protein